MRQCFGVITLIFCLSCLIPCGVTAFLPTAIRAKHRPNWTPSPHVPRCLSVPLPLRSGRRHHTPRCSLDYTQACIGSRRVTSSLPRASPHWPRFWAARVIIPSRFATTRSLLCWITGSNAASSTSIVMLEQRPTVRSMPVIVLCDRRLRLAFVFLLAVWKTSLPAPTDYSASRCIHGSCRSGHATSTTRAILSGRSTT